MQPPVSLKLLKTKVQAFFFLSNIFSFWRVVFREIKDSGDLLLQELLGMLNACRIASLTLSGFFRLILLLILSMKFISIEEMKDPALGLLYCSPGVRTAFSGLVGAFSSFFADGYVIDAEDVMAEISQYIESPQVEIDPIFLSELYKQFALLMSLKRQEVQCGEWLQENRKAVSGINNSLLRETSKLGRHLPLSKYFSINRNLEQIQIQKNSLQELLKLSIQHPFDDNLNFIGYLALARYNSYLIQPSKALKAYRTAIKFSVSDRILFLEQALAQSQLGRILVEVNQQEKGLQHLLEAIKRIQNQNQFNPYVMTVKSNYLVSVNTLGQRSFKGKFELDPKELSEQLARINRESKQSLINSYRRNIKSFKDSRKNYQQIFDEIGHIKCLSEGGLLKTLVSLQIAKGMIQQGDSSSAERILNDVQAHSQKLSMFSGKVKIASLVLQSKCFGSDSYRATPLLEQAKNEAQTGLKKQQMQQLIEQLCAIRQASQIPTHKGRSYSKNGKKQSVNALQNNNPNIGHAVQERPIKGALIQGGSQGILKNLQQSKSRQPKVQHDNKSPQKQVKKEQPPKKQVEQKQGGCCIS